jgi:predicted RNA-binding Zn-ribbon protein involved in translation (DUF1610 family)
MKRKLFYMLSKLFNYLTEHVPWNSARCRLDGHTYQYSSCPYTQKTYGDCTSCGHRVLKDTQASIV